MSRAATAGGSRARTSRTGAPAAAPLDERRHPPPRAAVTRGSDRLGVIVRQQADVPVIVRLIAQTRVAEVTIAELCARNGSEPQTMRRRRQRAERRLKLAAAAVA